MRIWKITTAPDLQRLIDEARQAGILRIADDQGDLKIKADEGGWSPGLGVLEKDDTQVDTQPAAPAEHLFEKCDGCHFFVERIEHAEYIGCEHSGTTLHQWGPVITGEHLLPHQVCVFCKQMRPQVYEHLTRGDDADELMTCDEARPSGRRANLLTWKTYGPLAMRERFTS